MFTNRLQEIEEIIAGSAPMSLVEIIEEEIKEFKQTEQYQIMVEAERYYRNRSDIQRKTNDLKNRSNVKMEHPMLKSWWIKKLTICWLNLLRWRVRANHMRMP